MALNTEPGSVEPVWKLQREHSATSRGPFNTEPRSLSDRVQQTPPRTQRWTTQLTHFAVVPRDLDPVAKAPRFCIEWCTLSGNLPSLTRTIALPPTLSFDDQSTSF